LRVKDRRCRPCEKTRSTPVAPPGVFAEVSASASLVKLTMCATICTTVPMTMVALWTVMFLSKGMKLVKGCATKEGDEIAADREKDEDDINMQDKGS
jgi:hypothetical protein